MRIELKDYQEKAVVKLRGRINELLDTEHSEILIFKSPTGSGKTVMVAETLRRVTDSRIDGKKLAFIWIAVNKLHDQSRDSLKKYYDSEAASIKCSHFQDIQGRQIKENEILFLNWASINKKDNIYIRENERNNNLRTIVERTKLAGRTIVLIIDESHHTAGSDTSGGIIKEIGAKVTIEVSATPQMTSDHIVPVQIDDIREEGMIKKEVVVNDGFESFAIDKRKKDDTADALVLKSALAKRAELAGLFEKAGSDVNPLLLIQLPDKKPGTPEKKEEILSMLSRLGYRNNDERVAIYLTGSDKVNLENIEKPQNEVEVMLFKQAIALGWDCPRATILVLFRQWSKDNITFSIQTLGRIMRMPEHRHYEANALNKAYLYTSLADIEARIDSSEIREQIKPRKSGRISAYRNVDLISYHIKRQREETRLSSEFKEIFLEVAEEQGLDKKVTFQCVAPAQFIARGRIKNTDKTGHTIEELRNLSIPYNELELQQAFDAFSRDNLSPFYPELRSIKRINAAIYSYFGASKDEDRWAELQAMVLADENRQHVTDVITLAKEKYQHAIGKRTQILIKNDGLWNVPESISYELSCKKKNYKKSVLQPYYAKATDKGGPTLFEEDSSIEISFIDFLEKSANVEWWFKNGVSDATFFAVPYKENEIDKAFYVDFIVKLKSGAIGLFDTKGGITAETAGARAKGLAEYIAKQNKAGKQLIGGIVIKDGNSWRYNSSKKYSYKPNDFTGWKILNLSE